MDDIDSRVILLVEDNKYDEELTVKALKMHGIQSKIVVTRDGVEALDYIFCRGPFENRPHEEQALLVLLDLKLPKLDGLEVLKQIRSHESTELLPVVVLTSSKEQEDVVKSYKSGAYSYIRKPVDFDEFMEAAKQIGAYWLLLNQNPPIRTCGR